MAAGLFMMLRAMGKSSYRLLGRSVVSVRLWHCQQRLERLEARRRQIDLDSRMVLLKRVHLEQVATQAFASAPLTPPRGAVPVLVRSMGRVVNG